MFSNAIGAKPLTDRPSETPAADTNKHVCEDPLWRRHLEGAQLSAQLGQVTPPLTWKSQETWLNFTKQDTLISF
ncbi:hypothetical protein E2C01_002240 [Portunus trituberculatus]|uniref:Uncharacterized protein n=1 Tax=Portunus trituberculatus TaxID=210409 RepID=A0A5B7CQ73_PORTR|nr:hypothetical protein [Portunus trituberculatus]